AMNHIVHARNAALDAPLGGKARALAALQRAGFPVPPWLAVLPGAMEEALGPVRLRCLQEAEGEADRLAALNGVDLSTFMAERRACRCALLSVGRGRAGALLRGATRQLPLRAAYGGDGPRRGRVAVGLWRAGDRVPARERPVARAPAADCVDSDDGKR